MIKNIFCDLDGTLLRGVVSDEDVEAIKRIEKKGVVFNVATGRTSRAARRIVDEKLDLNGYFITENGAFIHDAKGNLIQKATISDKLVKELVDKFNEIKREDSDVKLYYKYDGKTIFTEKSEAYDAFSPLYTVDPHFLDSFDHGDNIGNIGVASDDYAELERIEKLLKEEFSDRLDIYFTSDITLNIVMNTASKILGIKKVCELTGTTLDTTAGIGDSPNDFNMVDGCSVGFGMANGHEVVRNAADHVVSTVAEAIEIIEEKYL